KYIIAGETSDGAVMFIPAEAVFAEIHAHHAEVVEHAMARRVWIVSPTTLMAVLNTARAVLKDVETRRQVHVIKECLARLAIEFNRFDERMRDLARHIRQAHEDVEKVQLEALVRNVLPSSSYDMQCTLSNGTRADCVLKLPAPTGRVAIDAKFPLENYHRMFAAEASEIERAGAQKQFRQDLRRHIEAIGTKYIIAGETSDGAVMFIPAEAVFAEIHAHHAEVVEYAMARRVWIVSPTTLMAVLNTARAVLKDVETRRQVHVIKECLARLAIEFNRFDERMRDLARHIKQAHEDVEKVQLTSSKISQRFAQIEGVELAELESPAALRVVDLRDESNVSG
ncbi:MAG TPA: DNA recombination protein RmuC, partial [Burkholderiales bacterium]